MQRTRVGLTLLALAAGSAATVLAQGMPTTQPKFLHIVREPVKTGRAAEHTKFEAGWPAAFGKAKSKYNYVAITSMTGPQEAWFLEPYASQTAYGESLAMENDPVLGPELERLSKGDAEFVGDTTSMQLTAAPDLSRVKPGYDGEWVASTKAYKSAAARSAPGASWRTYSVVAGAPSGTWLVMSSTSSFADFDRMASESEATWKNMTAEESAAIGKFLKDGTLSIVTQRFRVDPGMSYVDAATIAKDPAFWGPKK
jgi:hypothetical protein